jgi:predicted small secreted protein
MKIIRVVAAVLAAAVLAAGCNTVEGLGKDLQKAGDAISSAAKKDEKKDEKR